MSRMSATPQQAALLGLEDADGELGQSLRAAAVLEHLADAGAVDAPDRQALVATAFEHQAVAALAGGDEAAFMRAPIAAALDREARALHALRPGGAELDGVDTARAADQRHAIGLIAHHQA